MKNIEFLSFLGHDYFQERQNIIVHFSGLALLSPPTTPRSEVLPKYLDANNSGFESQHL